MAGLKRGSKTMPRSFVEERLDLGEADLRLLRELIRTLSECKRRAVGHAVKEGLAASKEAMSEDWAGKSGVFKRAGVDLGLTKDHKDLVLRDAAKTRLADAAREQYLAGSFAESAEASSRKLEGMKEERIELASKIAAQKVPKSQGAGPLEAFEKKPGKLLTGLKSELEKLDLAIGSVAERIGRLAKKSNKSQALAESGLIPRCFGSKAMAGKLARAGQQVFALRLGLGKARKLAKMLGAKRKALEEELALAFEAGPRLLRRIEGLGVERSDLAGRISAIRKESKESLKEQAKLQSLWSDSRGGSWLFEGDKGAGSANRFVKFEKVEIEPADGGEEGVCDYWISIRLLDSQVAVRRQGLLRSNPGLGKKELEDKAKYLRAKLPWGQRMEKAAKASQSRPLSKSDASQLSKVREFLEALGGQSNEEVDKALSSKIGGIEKAKAKRLVDREAWANIHPGEGFPDRLKDLSGWEAPKFVPASEKYKGKTRPSKQPMGWRMRIEGGGSKAYARAEWENEAAECVSYRELGMMGVDINAWGIAWAKCLPDGNFKCSAESFGRLAIAWRDASTDKANDLARKAAFALVGMAKANHLALALEALDFEAKKRSLRYEEGWRAKALSGFAYQKLIEAIVARAAKEGVEIVWVDPAWTSVSGFAKYGHRLGLDADESAAFAIARKAQLSSKKESGQVKRRKTKAGWLDVAAREEKLVGCLDASGKLYALEKAKADALADKKVSKIKTVDVDVDGVAKGPTKDSKEGKASTQLCMGRKPEAGAKSPWSVVGKAMGRSRRDWKGILAKAANARQTPMPNGGRRQRKQAKRLAKAAGPAQGVKSLGPGGASPPDAVNLCDEEFSTH